MLGDGDHVFVLWPGDGSFIKKRLVGSYLLEFLAWILTAVLHYAPRSVHFLFQEMKRLLCAIVLVSINTPFLLQDYNIFHSNE